MGPASRFAFAIGLLASAGCRQLLGFDPATTTEDATTLPDASACVDLAVTCADANTLRTCTQLGTLPSDTACALGCVSTTGDDARCGQLLPSGGALTADDLVDDQLAALGDASVQDVGIDTDTGLVDGEPLVGADFDVVNNIAIFRARTLEFDGPISVIGSRAVVFAARRIVVTGILDLTPCGNQPSPGGFAGGSVNGQGLGPGGGVGSDDNSGGGGGGGYGGSGGNAVATGGAINGAATIPLLVGGSGGGGGNSSSSNRGGGGGGGGAIQLVATSSITIAAGAGINAGGCGAPINGCGPCTFGGGGAGGAILLEAPVITIEGALAVNGGGGGGAGGPGEDGRLDRTPAAGGAMGNGGTGGNGGAGGQLDGESALVVGVRMGGGGGGVGRIRVNTRSGTATVNSAAILSPAFEDPATTATLGTVGVR